MATTLIRLPRRPSRWCFEQAAPDVVQIEILAEINEFMPRERGDHERRLAADDLKQAIEEVHQPIKQAIAPETAAKVASGIASFRIDTLYTLTYSEVRSGRFVLRTRIGFQAGPRYNRRLGYLFNSENSQIPHGSRFDICAD